MWQRLCYPGPSQNAVVNAAIKFLRIQDLWLTEKSKGNKYFNTPCKIFSPFHFEAIGHFSGLMQLMDSVCCTGNPRKGAITQGYRDRLVMSLVASAQNYYLTPAFFWSHGKVNVEKGSEYLKKKQKKKTI